MITGSDGLIGKINNISKLYTNAAHNEAESLNALLDGEYGKQKVVEIDINNILDTGFTVNVTTKDIENIKEYVYYLKKASESEYTKETITEETKTYKELTEQTEYNIYVEVTDSKGNKIRSKEEKVITLDTIPALTEKNVEFIYTPDKWTNGDVQVEISTTVQGYTLQYTIDEENNWENYTTPIKITRNGQAIIARLEKDGRTGETATGNVKNIDKLAPITANISSGNITDTSFTLIAVGEDAGETSTNGKSGIFRYEFYVNGSLAGSSSSASYNVTGKATNTTYTCYVRVYDEAGNYKDSATISVKTAQAYSTSVNAVSLRGNNGQRFTFNIKGTTSGVVWGSDIYTDDSNIAKAAVHAGKVSVGQSKTVTIEIRAGQNSYSSTTRNGITTSPYGSWGGSYIFI